MSKHTPGPWAVVRDDRWGEINIESRNERDRADLPAVYVLAHDIGGMVHGDNCEDYSEVEANARLIAAAPELLAALTALLAEAEAFATAIRPYANSEALAASRAVIAKAKGESV